MDTCICATVATVESPSSLNMNVLENGERIETMTEDKIHRQQLTKLITGEGTFFFFGWMVSMACTLTHY